MCCLPNPTLRGASDRGLLPRLHAELRLVGLPTPCPVRRWVSRRQLGPAQSRPVRSLDDEHVSITQLGRDLHDVLAAVVPEGDLVLVGHRWVG